MGDEWSEWIDVPEELSSPPSSGKSEEGWSDWVDIPSSPPSEEPGWRETITTNIGTGAANVVGGVGSLIDMLPGFDFGWGKGIKDFAEPYQIGGEQFNQKIPEDSWKRTTGNVVQGIAGTAPLLPFGGNVPKLVGSQMLNTFGQRANQSERQLKEVVGPEAASEMAPRVGAIDALWQAPWNAIGMLPAFNQAVDPIRRVALAGGSNALFSIPSSVGSLYADYAAGANPTPPTWEETKRIMLQSPIEGGAIGMLLGGTQVGKEKAADYVATRKMQKGLAEMRARIDAYNEANQIKLLPAPEPKPEVLGLPSPDDPNVVYAEPPTPGVPHQELGDLSNPPLPKYQTQEQPFDKYRGSSKVRLLKSGTALEEGAIDPAANVIDARPEYSEIPVLGKQPSVKPQKIILEDYVGQNARDDFYQAQLRGEPVSKNLEIVPPSNLVEKGDIAPASYSTDSPEFEVVNSLLRNAKAIKEASPSGKLEAEAKAIVETAPKVQAEVQQLELQLPEVAQVDPVAAQQIQEQIVAKKTGLGRSQKRLEEINKELNPAPINSDPVVAKERMLEGELEAVGDGTLTFDNSSNVFPEGVEKPGQEPKRPSQPLPAEPREQSLPKILEESSTKPSEKKSGKASRLKSERGSIRLDFPYPFSTEGFKDFISRIKQYGFKDNPEHYKFFTSKWKNPLAAQITKAEKFPWYRKSHEASIKHFEDENSIAYDHAESIRPFDLLNAKEKQIATDFIYEANRRGVEFDSSDVNMKKLGLSDRVIRGVRAFRNTMDRALDMIKEEAVLQLEDSNLSPEAKAKKLIDINNKFDLMKVSNYAPQGRYGKYGVTIYYKDGKQPYFEMSDSKSKLLNKLYKEIRTNPNVNAETSGVNPIAKALNTEFIGAHPDIVMMLTDPKNSQIPQSSLLQHLENRKNIEGYDPDLGRNIASYLASHSRYIATQRLKRQFRQNNKEFEAFYETLGKRDRDLYSGLAKEIKDLQNYMLTPSDSWQKTRKYLSMYYLPFNPATLTTNLTSLVTTWPNAARYMSAISNATLQPEWLMAKSLRDVGKYYSGRAITGAKNLAIEASGGVRPKKDMSNPNNNVMASIELARKEGAIGGSRFVKDFLSDANSPSAKGVASKFSQTLSDQDILFLGNSMIEDFTKTSSHVLGWHLWEKAQPYFKKRNLPMPDRHTFAKNFANETQGDYRKTGSPNIAREGLGRLGTTFRLFPFNFFTILKKSVFNNTVTVRGKEIPFPNIGAASRFIGILGALGGVKAVPFLSTIIKGSQLAGFNPDEKIDETTQKVGQALEEIAPGISNYLKSPQGKNLIKYGVQPFGVTLSGGIDPSMIPPANQGGDPVGLAARVGLGVVTDIPDRLSKAKFFYDKGDAWRAAEAVAPRAFSINRMMSAARIKDTGLTDSHGRPMMPRKLTTNELIKFALGFTPSAVTAAYDLKAKQNKLLEEQDIGDIYERMAQAKIEGNDAKFKELAKDPTLKGKKASDIMQAVMKQKRRKESFKYNQITTLGKKNAKELRKLEEEFGPLFDLP